MDRLDEIEDTIDQVALENRDLDIRLIKLEEDKKWWKNKNTRMKQYLLQRNF